MTFHLPILRITAVFVWAPLKFGHFKIEHFYSTFKWPNFRGAHSTIVAMRTIQYSDIDTAL
jgi:hypothetical protein